MVTDYISERITSCGVTQIEKDGPSTAKAGNVVHLKTTFKFAADGNVGVGMLVDTLHPTPAVCGLPKEEAQQYIIETEQHDREYYTGFAGVVSSNKEAELYVNLRCMKVAQQLSLFAGGGITAKSVGEREWMETNHKLRTLQSIIEADD
jgi:isochorismate synthase